MGQPVDYSVLTESNTKLLHMKRLCSLRPAQPASSCCDWVGLGLSGGLCLLLSCGAWCALHWGKEEVLATLTWLHRFGTRKAAPGSQGKTEGTVVTVRFSHRPVRGPFREQCQLRAPPPRPRLSLDSSRVLLLTGEAWQRRVTAVLCHRGPAAIATAEPRHVASEGFAAHLQEPTGCGKSAEPPRRQPAQVPASRAAPLRLAAAEVRPRRREEDAALPRQPRPARASAGRADLRRTPP